MSGLTRLVFNPIILRNGIEWIVDDYNVNIFVSNFVYVL
jgi:hypothetical protein